MIITEEKFIIVTNDEKAIIKKSQNMRSLAMLSDKEDTWHIAFYRIEQQAKNACTRFKVYHRGRMDRYYTTEDLKVMKVKVVITDNKEIITV